MSARKLYSLLTPQLREEVISLYLQGLPVNEVATRLNLSTHTVGAIIRSEGISRPAGLATALRVVGLVSSRDEPGPEERAAIERRKAEMAAKKMAEEPPECHLSRPGVKTYTAHYRNGRPIFRE